MLNSKNYQICDILASVPASKRGSLNKLLSDLGEDDFLAMGKENLIDYAYGLDLEKRP